MASKRYEDSLFAAKKFEAGRELTKAIAALDAAEKQTHDQEELRHLRLLRERLKSELGEGEAQRHGKCT